MKRLGKHNDVSILQMQREHTEVFSFYSAASYNPDVYALAYGNNNTTSQEG